MTKLTDYTQVVEDDAYANVGAYIVELMATIRAVRSFSTVEELIDQVLSIIPRVCGRVDLVADSYREISWKNSTRAARGEGSFTILKSVKAKIQDTNAFLHEHENKSQLIKLFFNWLINNKRKTLNSLRTTSLYLSTEGYCQRLSISDLSSINDLMSTQEEADFRLVVLAKHAIDSNSPVIIRSHSGDTDIFIMALTLFYSANLILDSGTGAGRKIRHMSDVEMEEDNRNASIGFHTFTGCEYTSSGWKTMNSKSSFKEAIPRFVENDSVDDHLCRTLGEFVCTMYGGGHAKDVNTLRFNKFTEKQNREIKYVDLSALPPCKTTLKLHILRANRVAYLM